MTEQFQARGIAPRNIDVKMFGGANMFKRVSNNYLSVGDKNVESAKRVIADAGLSLLAFDVGAHPGARFCFTLIPDVFS